MSIRVHSWFKKLTTRFVEPLLYFVVRRQDSGAYLPFGLFPEGVHHFIWRGGVSDRFEESGICGLLADLSQDLDMFCGVG